LLQKFSTQSDVWSFGVFLWEVYSFGRTPYPSIPSDEVLETLEDGLLMDPPDGCPDDIYDIMCCCWDMEPSERPSFPSLQQMLSKSFGELHTGTDMHNLEGSPSVSCVWCIHASNQWK